MAGTFDKAPDSWYDDATKLTARHLRFREALRQPINEGKAYVGEWTNRPNSTFGKTQGEMMVDAAGMKDLGFNEMASALRAALTKICVPLQPRVSPIGGTWQTLKACEGLGQVADGFFTLSNFTKLCRVIMTHAAWVPMGGYALVDVDPVTKDFFIQSLDPFETFMNASKTEVTTLQAMDRRKALAMFGKTEEAKAAIKLAPRYTPGRVIGVDASGQWDAEDRVGIVRGWCETVGDSKGKFAVQILGRDEHTVIDHGDWEWLLPVFGGQWSVGMRNENDGRPLGRNVAPIHFWMNECVRKADDALAAAVPMVIGPMSAKPISDVPFQWIDSEQGPVTITSPKVMSSDIVAWMGTLKSEKESATGISAVSQVGTPPAHLKSGIALSTWENIDDKALSEQHDVYESLWIQAFRIFVSRAPDVYASKKAKALARGTAILMQIDFSKVKLKEDEYSLAFDAVSDLPKHIPQKFELLSALHELAPEEFDIGDVFQGLDVVDFKAAKTRINGPRDLMLKQISCCLDNDPPELITPDETQDHAKLAKLAAMALAAARAAHYPPPEANLNACLHLYLMAKQMAEDIGPAPGSTAIAPGAAPSPQLGGGITSQVPATDAAAGALPATGTAPVAQPLPSTPVA